MHITQGQTYIERLKVKKTHLSATLLPLPALPQSAGSSTVAGSVLGRIPISLNVRLASLCLGRTPVWLGGGGVQPSKTPAALSFGAAV